jgi:hypothetical protein
MAIFFKTISVISMVSLGLFFLSLIIYFFNLDMKASSKMQPLINKWYDGRKRRPLP